MATVLLTEPAERQRAEGEAEIAQSHVEIARKNKQVKNDAHEPSCDDVSEDSRFDSDPDACSDWSFPNAQPDRFSRARSLIRH